MILQQGDIIHVTMPGLEDRTAQKQLTAFYASYGVSVNMVSWVNTATSIQVVAVIRGYTGITHPLAS